MCAAAAAAKRPVYKRQRESREEGLNLHGHGVGGDGFPVDAVWDLNGRDARQTGGGLRRQRLQVQFSQAADKAISARTMAIP